MSSSYSGLALSVERRLVGDRPRDAGRIARVAACPGQATGGLIPAGDLHAVLGNDLPALRSANPDLEYVEDRAVVRVAPERLGVAIHRASRQERDVAEAANREALVLDSPTASLDSCDPGFLVLGRTD